MKHTKKQTFAKKKLLALLLSLATLTLVSRSAPEKIGGMDNSFSYSEEMEDAGVGEIDPADEDYGKFIENPFVATATQPISTFSADVDTASYAYFRKLVQSGYSLSELIATAGKSIRTEEMVNYFDYGYRAPEEGELFSTQMQIQATLMKPGVHHS